MNNSGLVYCETDENSKELVGFPRFESGEFDNRRPKIIAQEFVKDLLSCECSLKELSTASGYDFITYMGDVTDEKLGKMGEYYQWKPIRELSSLKQYENTGLLASLEIEACKGQGATWTEAVGDYFLRQNIYKHQVLDIRSKGEKRKQDHGIPIKKKVAALLIPLFLAVVMDYFFIFNHYGLSVMLMVLGLVLGGEIILGTHFKKQTILSFTLLLGLALISGSLIFFNNVMLKVLNTIAIPLLGALYFVIRTYGLKSIDLNALLMSLRQFWGKSFVTIPRYASFATEIFNAKKDVKKQKVYKNILLGIAFAIPFLIVIMNLLLSADLVFSYYVESFLESTFNVDVMEAIGHIFFIAFVTLFIFGFYWSMTYKEKRKSPLQVKSFIEPVIAYTFITMVNLTYLLFCIIQFSYLFTGSLKDLPNYITYAEYARSGFSELIMVALLNLIVIIVTKYLVKNGKSKGYILKIEQSFLVAMTAVMLLSAAYRMYLYENAYGFTVMRFLVFAFLFFIAIALLCQLLNVWMANFKPMHYTFLAGFIIYVGINVANIDGFIAKANIARYEETGKLDIQYLTSLSVDASKVLYDFYKECEDEKMLGTLATALTEKQDKVKTQYDKWFEYNFNKSVYLRHVVPRP